MNESIVKKLFVETHIMPYLKENDKPFNDQLWNDTIDHLQKEGYLTHEANNWVKTPKGYYQ